MQSACNESMKGNGETFILLSGSLDYSQRQAQSLFWTKCHRVGIQLTRRPARWLSNAYHCTYLLSILEILQYMVRHSVWRHTLAWIRTVEAHWFGLLQNWTTACKKNNTYTHLGAASCQWLQFSSTRPTSLCPDGVMQVLTWIYSISYKVGPSVALCWEWNHSDQCWWWCSRWLHSPEGPRWEEAQGVLLPWAIPHTDQLFCLLLTKAME